MANLKLKTFRGRGQAYALTLGTLAVVLTVGLAIPFVFGNPVQVSASAPLNAPAGSAGTSTGAGTTESTQAPDRNKPTATARSSAGPAGQATGPGAGSLPGATGPAAVGGADTAVTQRAAVATIKIGVPIFDLGFAVPGIDPKEQTAQWLSYINDVNANGGLGGRRLTVAFAGYDPLSADSVQAACLKLTEDEKVSVVFAYGLFDTQALCYTEQHHIPLFNGIGFSDEVYRRSAGRAFSVIINKTRAGKIQVAALDAMGVLKGKKIGILTSADRNDDQAAQGGIVRTLTARGYKVVQYSNLSSDLATGNSQIPVEVQQMIGKGVDLVFLGANLQYSGQFVQTGYSQNWKPQYVTSDLSQLAEDANTQRFGQGFDGAIGITVLREGEWRANMPEPAFDRRCRSIYERAAGVTYSRGQLVYNTTMAMCSVVDMFRRGLNATQGKFSGDALVRAMDTVGTFPVAYEADGSIGPGKHDAPAAARAVRWAASCSCYMPLAAYRPIGE